MPEPVKFNGASPLFSKVTYLGGLVVFTGCVPKFTLVGVSCTNVPVPDSGTLCGLSGALSVMEIEPLSGPLVVGLNVTFAVQLAPGPSISPQSVLIAN